MPGISFSWPTGKEKHIDRPGDMEPRWGGREHDESFHISHPKYTCKSQTILTELGGNGAALHNTTTNPKTQDPQGDLTDDVSRFKAPVTFPQDPQGVPVASP